MNLSIDQIKELVAKAENSFRHEECATCECYLGFITQLEIDADQEGQKHLKEYYQPLDEVHACLGCDPCSPGILYADYLRKKSTGTI
jgi:hypothetical protein